MTWGSVLAVMLSSYRTPNDELSLVAINFTVENTTSEVGGFGEQRFLDSRTGVPNLRTVDQYPCKITSSIRLEIKCTMTVIDFNPETIPPTQVCRKAVFHATGPWCQKGWGPML